MGNRSQPSFDLVRTTLERDGAPPLLIRQFSRAYDCLYADATGHISGCDIEPVDQLPQLADWAHFEEAGRAAVSRVAMIKLNGGLGTGMGLERAKSLLPVKDGLSFLDIIARQVLHIRQAHNAHTPLIFMNSFATRDDTLAVLGRYSELDAGQAGIPLDFVQHRVPKIDAITGGPAVHDTQPDLGWCPPGHGDIYVCLQTTGLLDRLVEHGFEYAFVSNADNLGAGLDLRILGYMASERPPFLMEATRRTAADRKGGHLAHTARDGLLLRESAQCPPDEQDDFQNIDRYRYFNTNSLWINLPALREVLNQHEGVLPLPVMINHKTLDPRDAHSPAVVQLETAMGSALSAIPGAVALDVPRTRFAPVKSTDDLLALRSDCFLIDEAYHVVPEPKRTLPAIDVQLDPAYFKFIDRFDKRFPFGPPSLCQCESLRVQGDFRFGQDIACHDRVELINKTSEQILISDGSRLTGSQTFGSA